MLVSYITTILQLFTIFSDLDGLLRLENMFNNIPKNSFGADLFRIQYVRQISTSVEAINFLQSIENVNRHTVKRIVLDCSAKLAKEILIDHVRSVRLGR